MEEEVTKRNKYWEKLPLAYEIYYAVFGDPKTHQEWANGFNIRGKIIETLIKENGNKKNHVKNSYRCNEKK